MNEITKLLALAVLALFPLAASVAVAEDSIEDAFHYGNSVGKSGWDLYSDDEDIEEDQLRSKELARQAAQRAAEKEKQKRREADFFGTGVDVYDKSISRTENEQDELTNSPE